MHSAVVDGLRGFPEAIEAVYPQFAEASELEGPQESGGGLETRLSGRYG